MDLGNGRFRLEAPNWQRQEMAKDYIAEYFKSSETTDRAIFFNRDAVRTHGTGGLFQYAQRYNDWLKMLQEKRQLAISEEDVPTETYFLIREERSEYLVEDKSLTTELVGMVNIRLGVNDDVWEYDGNIGYNIRPSKRGLGYSKVGLFLALCMCQKHGLESVLLTCNRANLASQATIRALDGRLMREKDNSQYVLQFYSVDLEAAIANHEAEYARHIAEWPN